MRTGFRKQSVPHSLFSEGKAGRSPQPSGQEEVHIYEQPSDVPRFETTTEGRSWLVRTTENINVAPRSRQVATGRLDLEKGLSLPSLVCVEPALIPIQGVLTARVHTSRDNHTAAFTSSVTARLC